MRFKKNNEEKSIMIDFTQDDIKDIALQLYGVPLMKRTTADMFRTIIMSAVEIKPIQSRTKMGKLLRIEGRKKR